MIYIHIWILDTSSVMCSVSLSLHVLSSHPITVIVPVNTSMCFGTYLRPWSMYLGLDNTDKCHI